MRSDCDHTAIPPAAYSIPEFCAAHRISQDFYFKLRKLGKTPKPMKVGARTLISVEAAAQWRRDRERDAEEAEKRKYGEPADQPPSDEA